jgi:hypothetical protein
MTDSLIGQPLDTYKRLLYIGARRERPRTQLLELKADPNFLKN